MTQTVSYISAEDFQNVGYLQEINRRFLHPLGMALEADMETDTFRIWDYRDDPEGVRFEGLDLFAKANNVSSIENLRRDVRVERLGYWIQPSGVER